MNRKSKAILYAALGVIGFVGASASAGANRQVPQYHLEDGDFELLNPSQQNQPGGWRCQSAPTVTCTYRKINQAGDTIAENMTRSQSGNYQTIAP